MDEDKASRFISSLVKSIQALCNGFVDFSTSIEVVGHIHLNIDRSVKLDYVLTEEVSKSVSEGSTVFSSHSYHSQPPSSVSSKSASDTPNHGQKSRKDNETDPLGLSALPREVPNTSKSESHSHSSNRVSESSNSSHSYSSNVGFSRNSESESMKQESNRSSCQVEDSLNKRRKLGQLSQRTPSPAAKRSRSNEFSSRTVVKEPGFEVIEIKEEPDEEPSVFFGNTSSGQDIQTPDFSNVVMESIDRVNQIEQGTDLGTDGGGGDGMAGSQQPVFPVMFHQSDGMGPSSAGAVPGPSSDPQSVASTSGEELLSVCRPPPSTASSSSTLSRRWGLSAAFPSFSPTMMSQIQHPAFSALSRSLWMSGGIANYKPRPRLQYTASQISAAIQDVEMGKSISKAAKDNGVPFTSLYRKVKARSSQQTEEPQRTSGEEPFHASESVPALDAITSEISFLDGQKTVLDEAPEATDIPEAADHGVS